MTTKIVKTPHLEITYREHGAPDGWPVILSHGFPYDIHAYDGAVSELIKAGAHIIVPYLRGFGGTRFLDTSWITGQQAALGSDIIELLDALEIKEPAVLAGFDWGGLASCVASALWPDRVAGLVSYAGYDIIDRSEQGTGKFNPSLEKVMWYQHLFQSERGRQCLSASRRELCRLLWEEWSPTWRFGDEQFEMAMAACEEQGDDWADVVIHAYRFVFGNEEGLEEYAELERRLAEKPAIKVNTITLDGGADPLKPGGSAHHAAMFVGRHERREHLNVGHAFPYEAPGEFTKAILDVHQWAVEHDDSGQA